MKIGKASFNVAAVKKMTLKQFQDSHKHVKGDLEAIYNQIKGKKSEKKEDA